MPAHEVVAAYHERTKHQYDRLAAARPALDWATKPDPFRRYAGAEQVKLPLASDERPISYASIYAPNGIAPAPLDLGSLALFFRYSLSLTAWKRAKGAAWSLRANPSTGNLHPTEGYAILPPLAELHPHAGVYHYVARDHGLERRREIRPDVWEAIVATYPDVIFLVGLSSIQWRESWKYGERAFRYCEQDVGHALGAMRLAAAALGWRLTLLAGAGDDDVARTLGLDRDADYAGAEREQPELIAIVTPADASRSPGASRFLPRSFLAPDEPSWSGAANVLGPAHGIDWPAIEEVTLATHRRSESLRTEDFTVFPVADELVPVEPHSGVVSAESVILGRRSAIEMDGATAISATTFYRMLGRLMPTRDHTAVPWDAIAWRPRVHLGLFVHRVTGLAPGLYVLVRDPERIDALRDAMRPEFRWERPPGCPPGLGLFLLVERDTRALAALVSCAQNVAGDGAFSVAMLADFAASLKEYGPAFYRNLFWEAGMIGQVLYLEAEEATVGSTGIGSYFDDPVHEIFGLTTLDWQSFYHFAVGAATDDPKLTTFPGYGALSPDAGRGETNALASWESEGGNAQGARS